MKQLKPMEHAAETKFFKVYKYSKIRKTYVESPRETEKFLKSLNAPAIGGEDLNWTTKGFLGNDEVYTGRVPGCDELFMVRPAGYHASIIDASGVIFAESSLSYGHNDDYHHCQDALKQMPLNIAKNPELLKMLPSGILEAAAKFKIDFKREVLAAYTARFEEYINGAEVDVNTDLTEATQSAQAELGMLKETLINMEKEFQAKHQKKEEDKRKEAYDKKTVALRKQDAISNLKSTLESEDTEAE